MTLDFDVSQVERCPSKLVALVKAIVAADPEDESSWLEWKSELALGTAAGNFEVAKAILSFANRLPDVAERTCGGLAYVVIGAEAGRVIGVKPMDPAELDDHLNKYVGSDGPDWHPNYVTVRGGKVLVIVVEPPRWGDRMHTLRKPFGGVAEGTVFVRRQAKSVPADHSEVRGLEDRRERGLGPAKLDRLEVNCASHNPDDGVLVVDRTPAGLDQWLAQRRKALRSHQQLELDNAKKSQGGSLYAKMVAESASVNEAAIEAHLIDCKPRMLIAQHQYLVTRRWGMVTFTVTSRRSDTLEDVELVLSLDSSWSAFTEHDPELEAKHALQAPPPLAGTRLLGSYARKNAPIATQVRTLALPRPRRYDYRINITNEAITLQLGQLRPGRTASSSFHLFLHDVSTATTEVPLRWELHSPSTDGVQAGELQLHVHPVRKVFADHSWFPEER